MTDYKLYSAKFGAAKVIALAGLSGPLGWVAAIFLERLFNWLANKGIMLMNVGIINFQTDMDQKAFESAIESAYAQLEGKKNKLTKEELDAIDNKVIAAFDKFVVFDKVRDN